MYANLSIIRIFSSCLEGIKSEMVDVFLTIGSPSARLAKRSAVSKFFDKTVIEYGEKLLFLLKSSRVETDSVSGFFKFRGSKSKETLGAI